MLSRYPLAWSLCAWLLGVADAVELTEMFGEIRSPNFPDSYPSNSEVTWNISVPEGFKIKLYFMHFDLESSYLCEYDYVKVSGGIRGRTNEQVGHVFGQQGVLEKLGTRYFSPFVGHRNCLSSGQQGERNKLTASIGLTSGWDTQVRAQSQRTRSLKLQHLFLVESHRIHTPAC